MTSDAYVPSLWCRFMLKTIEEEVEEKKKGWRIAVLIENWHKRPICRCRPIEKCYYCQRQQEAAHDFVYSSMAMSTGERTSHIALCAPKRSSLTRNGAVVKSPSMYGALTFDSPTKELRKDPRYNKAITFTLHFIRHFSMAASLFLLEIFFHMFQWECRLLWEYGEILSLIHQKENSFLIYL